MEEEDGETIGRREVGQSGRGGRRDGWWRKGRRNGRQVKEKK